MVAFPTQSALLVAGILGIVVYKEITATKKIVGFLAASGVLLLGAALLATFGVCTTPDVE